MSDYNFIDDSSRKSVLDKIDKLRKKVSEINLDIMDSLAERQDALGDIESLLSSIGSSEYFFGTDYDLLETEWTSLHFKSGVVRKAVATVRKYFFDDTEEESRSFNCCGLKFETWYSGYADSIEFTFTNGTYVFSVLFPSISRTRLRSRLMTSDYYGKEIFPENKWLGKISVSVEVNKYSTENIESSAKFEDVRETISKLIHNFEETVNKKLLEESKRYKAYQAQAAQAFDRLDNGFRQDDGLRQDDSDSRLKTESESLGDMLVRFGYISS